MRLWFQDYAYDGCCDKHRRLGSRSVVRILVGQHLEVGARHRRDDLPFLIRRSQDRKHLRLTLQQSRRNHRRSYLDRIRSENTVGTPFVKLKVSCQLSAVSLSYSQFPKSPIPQIPNSPFPNPISRTLAKDAAAIPNATGFDQ